LQEGQKGVIEAFVLTGGEVGESERGKKTYKRLLFR